MVQLSAFRIFVPTPESFDSDCRSDRSPSKFYKIEKEKIKTVSFANIMGGSDLLILSEMLMTSFWKILLLLFEVASTNNNG